MHITVYKICIVTAVFLVFTSCFTESLLLENPYQNLEDKWKQVISRAETRPWDINRTCVEDIGKIVNGLDVRQTWAWKAFDAQGSRVDFLGSYSLCKEASNQNQYDFHKLQDGLHFCYFQLQKSESGVCVPRSCSKEEVSKLFTTDGTGISVLCEEDLLPSSTFHGFYIARTIFIGIFLMNIISTLIVRSTHSYLTILSTICDKFRGPTDHIWLQKLRVKCGHHTCLPLWVSTVKKWDSQIDNNNKSDVIGSQEQEPSRVLKCFDLVSNLEDLTSCDSQPVDSYTCLPGVRCLAMVVIMFFHTYYYQSANLSNTLSYTQFLGRYGDILNSCNLAVEAFFVISGMLAFIQGCSALDRKFTFRHLVTLYIKRLWRLAPAYMGIITFHNNIFLSNVHNPRFRPIENIEQCQNALPYQMTFTYNLALSIYGMERINCMAHSWYISADFQLFLFVPVFVYIWKKKPSLGFISSVGAMVLVFVATGFFVNYKRSKPNSAWALYGLVSHINSYIIGVFLGMQFQYSKTKDIKHIIRKNVILLLALFFVVLLYFGITQQPFPPITILASIQKSILEGSFRNFFAALVGLLIYYCTMYRSFLGTVLSSQCWQPLAKLSYSIYLISCAMQRHYFYTRDRKQIWSFEEMLITTGGVLVVSTLQAAVVWLFIERPCEKLGRLIFKRRSTKENICSDT